MQWIQMLIGFALVGCGTMIGWYVSKGTWYSRGRGEGFLLAVKIYRESFMNMERDGIIKVDWAKMKESIDGALKSASLPTGNVVPFPTKDN